MAGYAGQPPGATRNERRPKMNSEHLKAIAAVDAMSALVWDNRGTIEWVGSAVETAETIADFQASAKNYAECTKAQHGEIAGFPYIAYKNVQPKKGQPRHPLSVIDFGDYRVAVNEFLPDEF